jgi:hypothetical protein
MRVSITKVSSLHGFGLSANPVSMHEAGLNVIARETADVQ